VVTIILRRLRRLRMPGMEKPLHRLLP
jgi:hypothetical protein